ncbi:iron chaperone [Herbiconiux sp. UC225_62]|uniref:iron chaperone n=1 Tax=Herbiconiux sp. UC225_62 TaxID=3350168 RepID=UPI0036D37A6C
MTETTTSGEKYDGFTAEEREAMKERAKELKTAARRPARSKKVDGLTDLLEKIAEMPAEDRAIAERVHAVIMASGPDLEPRTWYGQPAYAKDGQVVCFFQSASKFKTRYSTLGFNEAAKLDDGPMWPTAFALLDVTPAVEKQIAALVEKALG